MDTYTQRMKVLTDLPEAWQSGSQATVCNLESLAVLSSDHGAPASTSKIETDEMPSIQPSYSNVVVATAKPLTVIKLPAKMKIRGRPKGCEVTAIGLPCKKNKRHRLM